MTRQNIIKANNLTHDIDMIERAIESVKHGGEYVSPIIGVHPSGGIIVSVPKSGNWDRLCFNDMEIGETFVTALTKALEQKRLKYKKELDAL